jgi:cytochrome o ubiquinol oxidase operon protein cyoD
MNNHGSLQSYVIGFIASLALTMAAYLAVTRQWAGADVLLWIIVALAVLQLLVQLVFFLHLPREGRPAWKRASLFFAVIIVAIVVFGSVWIMNNLHYNMMPSEVEDYIFEEEQIEPLDRRSN